MTNLRCWPAPTRPALLLGSALLLLASPARSDEIPAQARPFFADHCVHCHDADGGKGGLDLEGLAWNPDDPRSFDRWVAVLDRVDRREMPPPTEDRPDPAARARFLATLRGELHASSLGRQEAEGRVGLRRLNRVEYEKTLHDLLAIDLPLQHFLPEEASSHGFDNVAESLRVSMLHMEQYLEAADAAISAAIDLRKRPEVVRRRFRYHDEESVLNDAKKPGKKSFRVLPDAVVVFDDNSPTVLHRFRGHDRGRFRIRISASAYQAAGRPAWLKLYATDFKTKRMLGYFDLPADGMREVDVIADLTQGELLDLSPYDTNYDDKGQVNYNVGAEAFAGRGVAIQWVEIEGPLLEAWPPPSVGRLFGATRVEPAKLARSDRRAPAFAIVPDDPRSAAEPLLLDFTSRAFRRPVAQSDVRPYVALAHRGLDDGLPFESAMDVAFRAVLTSARFLFLDETPGTLDDWALASRLSYFLWSAPPDHTLRDLADGGTLHEPAILRGQVERMLASPRSRTFVENFVGQWLDLRQIDSTQPEKKLYPEFDDILRASMLGETEEFFAQLLREDGRLGNLVHSDFLMLNRRLAEHYQIQGVVGEEIRRVPLPPECHRGGVLTQASVLKVTANGTNSSPVLRGAWVMKRLLGEPLPPPPTDVPAFEPDTRGASTIRAQLAKHRSLAACASCHDRMDPPGFALENFDVIGGWRERYRVERGSSVGPGDIPKQKFRGRDIWEYRLGPTVDASGKLADGREFREIDEFKQLLLEREDQVARNLTRNLLVYATGAGIQFADREVVEQILDRLKSRGGGLRMLVHEIVQCRAFRCK
jgi:mono/diheme cytochrome c family protein